MAFDSIVFTQDELNSAVSAGCTAIALCDGSFDLPLSGGVTYTAIGAVEASADASREEFDALGIKCVGFEVRYTGARGMAVIAPCSMSSYSTSYTMSSYFMNSYRYAYELSGSFVSSYTTSYTTSYNTSYISSYTTSYQGSFSVSIAEELGECVIMVNGYGINLI